MQNRCSKLQKNQSFQVAAPPALISEEEYPIQLHNQFHRNGLNSAAQSLGWLALTGAELHRIKKTIELGSWENWVEANCEFSVRTAQRYMALADGLRGRMRREALEPNRGSLLSLLDTRPNELSADEQSQLIEIFQKVTGGETLRQLYLALGIMKKPQGSGVKGGYKGGSKGTAKDTPKQAAIDIFTPLLKSLLYDGIHEGRWVDLPDSGEVSRESLLEALTDLAQKIRAAMAAPKLRQISM